jgi:hypothetical protein
MYAEASRPRLPSDTDFLVDACLAQVREVARLDDELVLPPLPVVVPVAILTKSDTCAEAFKRSVLPPTQLVPRSSLSASAATRAPAGKRPSRWPMALCGFIAGAAACAAFLASPAGHRPGVVRVTHSIQTHATSAAHSTAAFFTRLLA